MNRIGRKKRRNRKVFDTVKRFQGNLCYLCGRPLGEKTPSGCTRPAPDAPTMDHVIPASKGGKLTVDNVRICHAMCNEVKGDKPLSNILQWGTTDMKDYWTRRATLVAPKDKENKP